MPFTWKSEPISSRKFVDLIWRRSSKWAVWDPPIQSPRLGDYGRINPETGVFEREGNIYEHPELSAMVASCKQDSGQPQEEVLAVSSSENRRKRKVVQDDSDLGFGLGSGFGFGFGFGWGEKKPWEIERDKQRQKEREEKAKKEGPFFDGKWEFGRKSGAVLAAYKPTQTFLPYDLDYELVAKTLPEKLIVSSITVCPAYAMYLGSKEDEGISLTIQKEAEDTTAIKWVKEYSGGFYREGNHSEPAFTVLFDLRRGAMRQKKTWLRDSPEPDFEGTDKLDVVHPPWGILDEDGEEEPPYVHRPYKLPLNDDDWD